MEVLLIDSPIHATLWDLGGVLVRTEDPSPRQRWERELGLRPGQLSDLVFKCEASERASVGRASVEDVWSWVGLELGLDESDLQRLAEDFWKGDVVDRDLMDEIRRLRADYKTGLISNAWPSTRRRLEEEWDIAGRFDVIVLSYEAGMVKPDPTIYRMALDRLDVAPQEAVFIDDFEPNVAGAQAVGMHAVRFVGRNSTLEKLRELLES